MTNFGYTAHREDGFTVTRYIISSSISRKLVMRRVTTSFGIKADPLLLR